ncbi:MAG: 50S ribosomal protein L6 [Bacteroidia bacterium]|nr:50S ribosomal protein L6 [Bacteroidia bacterium]
MSRIGKAIIKIPASVSISRVGGMVTVKGPKGTLTQYVHPDITYTLENGDLQVQRPSDQKRHRELHGLYRSLLNNLVTGVTEGFSKEMELIGVGYKAEAKGQILEMSLGFSHGIQFVMPEGITVATETLKGQPPKITLKSIDKQLLGFVAAKIRTLRPPEPYKGKGIRFVKEVIRRKAGKTSGKGGKK